MSKSILLVDDEERLLEAVGTILRVSGHRVCAMNRAEAALETMQKQTFDVALVDLNMPGMSGLQLISSVAERHADLPIVVMSGVGRVSTAVEAMRRGAVDYVEKPVEPSVLESVLDRVFEHRDLKDRHERLLEDVFEHGGIVGESPAMDALRGLISRVAPSDARVLILGENGTGKELVANAIHEGSARSSGPFVKLNCSALPAHLLESELFGHERGAFTGAHARRRGRFELADGGTLFLDEVGDMPLDMQAKILRVLQEGQFERVGGANTLTVDVRILAATNKDLVAMVEQGSFREDLYYRLNVVTVCPPPLRERAGDVALLARHFNRVEQLDLHLSSDALRVLDSYAYPGNVRELRNVLERLSILAGGRRITASDVRDALPARIDAPQPPRRAAPVRARRAATPDSAPPSSRGAATLEDLERERVLDALEASNGRRSVAAEMLGMSRSTLWRRIKALGLAH